MDKKKYILLTPTTRSPRLLPRNRNLLSHRVPNGTKLANKDLNGSQSMQKLQGATPSTGNLAYGNQVQNINSTLSVGGVKLIGKMEKSGSEMLLPKNKQLKTIDMVYNIGIQTTSMASYSAYGLIPPQISVSDYSGVNKHDPAMKSYRAPSNYLIRTGPKHGSFDRKTK